MDIKLKKAKALLKKYNQEHLLYFYDELSDNKKDFLLNQILNTDFKNMQKYYKNSFKDDSIDYHKISPIDYISKLNLTENQRNKYKQIGNKIISNGKLAVLTLAGGQGTRLGYKGPKGCYEIEVPPKKSLFEFLCDKLKKVYKDYGVYLNWYIMTSPYNDSETKKYFEEKNYFDYPKEKIFFFTQGVLPITDKEGKIILDKIYTLKEASNGNGDVFKAFSQAHLQNTLFNIDWISISGIDNIILDIIDPLLLGLASYNKSDIAAKSIPKEDINSKDYVFANVCNRPNIIEPSNLTEKMLSSKNKNGLYNYNQINILSHLFTKKAFLKASKFDIRYHRAFKKNDYINEEGMKVVPSEPNSFKFEKFIFDVFKFYKNFTLLEVQAIDEFAPIKSFTGNATPETALKLYLDKQNRPAK